MCLMQYYHLTNLNQRMSARAGVAESLLGCSGGCMQMALRSWMSALPIYWKQICRNTWGFHSRVYGVSWSNPIYTNCVYGIVTSGCGHIHTRSADLNSVENVWAAMSRCMRDHHTRNRVAVENKALQSWERLRCARGSALAGELVASVPRRLNSVSAAGNTN